MLEINFAGPYALLPNADAVPYLLAAQDAWTPGLYLQTFLYNQAHRVNLVGAATDSIAQANIALVTNFLSGKCKIYESDGIAQGELITAYDPSSGRDELVGAVDQMMLQLAGLRIFYAPFSGSQELLRRVAAAITAHYHRLGGKAVAWMENEPVDYDAGLHSEQFTLRIGRPAFIASLPDEMHL